MLSGLAVGWRVHTGRREFLAGVAPAAPSPSRCPGWASGSACSCPSVEVAQQVGFIVIFPLTFVSNVFVPPETLPAWLQPFAEWNPVSALTAATRELFGNPNPYADRRSRASTRSCSRSSGSACSSSSRRSASGATARSSASSRLGASRLQRS